MRNQSIDRIMTTPAVVVEPGTDINMARQLMAKKTIHHLPVVEAGRLVGILSTTDLVHVPAAAPGLSTVADLMQAGPISIPVGATLQDAAGILASGMFHGLPVTDASGAVVGMVTSTDLVRLLLQQLPSAAGNLPESHEVPAAAAAGFADRRELETAVHAAERHHASGDDPDRLAGAVIFLNAKVHQLETVLQAADLYLHSGHGEREHSQLVRAITRAKEGASSALRIGRM